MIFKTRCVVTQGMPQQAAKIKIQTFVYFQKKLYIPESILIIFLSSRDITVLTNNWTGNKF